MRHTRRLSTRGSTSTSKGSALGSLALTLVLEACGLGTITGISEEGLEQLSVPQAPSELIAEPGDQQVTLSWSTSLGASTYRVKRATASGGPYTQIVEQNGVSHLDTERTNDTTYFYVVSALNEVGESPNSAQVSATPAAATPATTTPATTTPATTTPATTVVGPTCTQIFAEGSAMSEVQSAINAAEGGAVICLTRGASWSGTLSIDNTRPDATSRITVCAGSAVDNACTSSGDANPRINGNGTGISISSQSNGFVFKDIDVVCAATCTDNAGVDLHAVADVRFEGGNFSGWSLAFLCNSFGGTVPCDNIEFGVPGNLAHVYDNGMGFFGWLSNSFVRLDAHDNGGGSVFDHHWYLSSGPQTSPSFNVVFEHGHYTRSSVANGRSAGTFLNLSGQNEDVVIRNNVFDEPACGTYFIDCGSGGEDPEEFCDGLEIYNNVFRGDCPMMLNLDSTQHARVYNNIFDVVSMNGSDDIGICNISDGERNAADGWLFNNTVHCPTSCGSSSFFRFDGASHRVFNNLLYVPVPGTILFEDCNAFGGTGGPDFDNNFLYAPGATPRLPSCGAGSGNSTVFNQNPGFADASNGQFQITDGSPAAGFGTTTAAPSTDFAGNNRPAPPSAGAFDVP